MDHTLSTIVYRNEPDRLLCLSIAWCTCGAEFTAVSGSPRLCERALRIKHRKHRRAEEAVAGSDHPTEAA